MRHQDMVIFITGANRGLGLSLARAALSAGVRKVYAASRDPSQILLPGLHPVRLDVTRDADAADVVRDCRDVNVLINNAGIARGSSLLAAGGMEAARAEFETNFYGPWRMSLAFAPVLAAQGGGAIVNVLSVLSWLNLPGGSTYCASKSAAWGLTNALRNELRAQQTQVMGVHIGFMDTELTAGVQAEKVSPDDVARQILGGTRCGPGGTAGRHHQPRRQSRTVCHAWHLPATRRIAATPRAFSRWSRHPSEWLGAHHGQPPFNRWATTTALNCETSASRDRGEAIPSRPIRWETSTSTGSANWRDGADST